MLIVEQSLIFFGVKLISQAAASCGNDQNSEWRPAEAALYCIRAIADYVSIAEAELMTQVQKPFLALI